MTAAEALGVAPDNVGAAAHPLRIQNVGDDTCIVMSKGFHDPHEFMRAVRAAGYDWPLGMPAHKWVKAVPSRDPSMRCAYVFVQEGARGAFPATYAWEAYGDDRYEALVSRAQGDRVHLASGEIQ